MALGVSSDVVSVAEQMLADAYELILSGWCQGMTAQDAEGRPIEPSSAFARRWSAPGALERVWQRAIDRDELALDAYERASLALSAAIKDVPQRWNDVPGRRVDEVLDGLASALPLLRPAPISAFASLEDLIEETHHGDGAALLFAD
jgi:hypothetical protein